MFSENLRVLRKLNGYTQKEVAAGVGVSFRTIQNYENGHGYPQKKQTLYNLANFFGVSVSSLLGPEDFFPELSENEAPLDTPIQLRVLLSDLTVLFAGGKLSEEDQNLVLNTLSELYLEAKSANPKAPGLPEGLSYLDFDEYQK